MEIGVAGSCGPASFDNLELLVPLLTCAAETVGGVSDRPESIDPSDCSTIINLARKMRILLDSNQQLQPYVPLLDAAPRLEHVMIILA
jgi:hypothetical protein